MHLLCEYNTAISPLVQVSAGLYLKGQDSACGGD